MLKGKPKTCFILCLIFIGVFSYLTVTWPHIIVPIMLAVMLMTFLYVLWIFAKMITEDD